MKRTTKLLASLLAVGSSFAVNIGLAQDSETLFDENCAACHLEPTSDRTPSKDALGRFSNNSIYYALTEGLMQEQAAAMSDEQKRELVQYLTGREFNGASMESLTACARSLDSLNLDLASNWNGWGNGAGNPRAQTDGTRIGVDNINSVELAWAFGFEGASVSRAQPTIVDGVMMLGSPHGTIYALDLESGCSHWTFPATAEVRGAMQVVYSDELEKALVVVADVSNRIYVLDALTGEKLWHDDVDPHPYARSTGSPVVSGDKIFVPVSSVEVAVAGNPQHPCCTGRGNVASYDLNTGEKLWHTYIMEEAKKVGETSIGTPILAPAGAPIWDAPTIDTKRNLIYVGTGQNYTRPASDTSDAVIAFDMDTGEIEWVQQTQVNDAFTMACTMRNNPNCSDAGPDIDIGASIMSTTLSNGQDILIAGSKGGTVYGLDPDADGKILWQTQLGAGSSLGGVHWGMSFIGDIAYVPISDRARPTYTDVSRKPGLHALDMKTGEILWYIPAPKRCAAGMQGCGDS
ncbi:MAG: PQQ-binding-like beta-propeller repeat protein [Pseudohongiellaceae bacterium]|nr:PQQ-binding-like beta-propeller repeat protein [Pseudohongiellaceae bacterium]